MCYGKDTGGGEGGTKTKKQAANWYNKQVKDLQGHQDGHGIWRNDFSIGTQLLIKGQFIAWFKWVFLQLDNHEASCKWRKLGLYLGLKA